MKYRINVLVSCLFLLPVLQDLSAQVTKGVKPIGKTEAEIGNKYAVVIGISDYQDENIPDLRFADRDAEAFANFLRSPAGGSLDENRLKILLNEEATIGNMVSSLDWLLETCQEGDQAIIYFSGHGDVEQKTRFQLGFLLPWDSPPKSYAAGAFHLYYLEAILSTLSLENKAKVILVADACRSGKLAGSSVNGSQLTNANLAKQFENVIKILSCQPDEYSIEGIQWGGGRGAFSYHLIDGLYGKADRDNNQQVNVLEIGRYLEDHVTSEAAPLSQIPMTVGNSKEKLVDVNSEVLAALQENDEELDFVFAGIESKGIEDVVLEKVSPEQAKMYADFRAALEQKYFLPTDKNENTQQEKSASELYDILIQEEELIPLFDLMKRIFAAALQDEAHQAIVAYLKAEPEEMEKRYVSFGAEYKYYPVYLEMAADLLGPAHYIHNHLKAKQYYFEGLLLRLEGDRDMEPALYDLAFERLEQALEKNNDAAYIYNELGYIKQRKGIYQYKPENHVDKIKAWKEATVFFDESLLRAPTWRLPLVNSIINYRMLRKFNLSDSLIYRVLELEPDFHQAYNYLGDNLIRRNKRKEAIAMYKKAYSLLPDDESMAYDVARMHFEENNFEEAIKLYKKAIEIDPNYFAGHLDLGHCYSSLGIRDSAIVEFKKTISIRPKELNPYMWLAYEYMYDKQFKKAKQSLETLNSIEPGYYEYHFGVSCLNALQGKLEESLEELEKAIVAGLPYSRIPNDSDIDAIRGMDGYGTLLRKYFPEKGSE